jgi:hypothetical protein
VRLTAQHLPLEVQGPKRVPEGAGVRPARLGSCAKLQVDQLSTSRSSGRNAQTVGLHGLFNTQFCGYLNLLLFEAVLTNAVEADRDNFPPEIYNTQNRRAFSAIAG